MRRRLVLLGIAALAAGALVSGRSLRGPGAPLPFSTARAAHGSLLRTVATDGRVASHLDVDLRCKGGGEVVRVPADVGDAVKKGDLLLELEPSTEERAAGQAEAGLRAARVRLAQAAGRAALAEKSSASRRASAEAALRGAAMKEAEALERAARLARLLAKELVSRSEVDAAEAAAGQAQGEAAAAQTRLLEAANEVDGVAFLREEVRLAEAQEESARLELAGARQRLAEMRVRSPIDGVLTRRSVSVGQVIPPAAPSALPVLTVSDLSRIYVLASVDESDIGRVREGARAAMTLDAFPGEAFAGTVVRLASRGTNVSNVVTFEVKIEVLGENRRLLRPEMTASVQLTAEERSGALLVPARALRRSGARTTVRVVSKGGEVEERAVVPGGTDGTSQEIVAGLTEGEAVIVEAEGPAAAPSPPPRKKKFWNLSG